MFSTDLNIFNLNDVIGQDTIVKTLKNYLNSNNFPSVLYLIGQSGSGKSLIANIVAATLNCEHPETINGIVSPCGKCASCKDIQNEFYQMGVRRYNGGMLNVEGLREIETFINYSSFMYKNKIIILNEAQMIKELKRLLEIIEQRNDNVYFIFTSTDTEKFKNVVSSKDNADQEKQALRSRGCFLNFKPVNEEVIAKYLFKLLSDIDPEEKVPEIFVSEGIQAIASNANGNVRLAVNDFHTALNGEVYDEKGIIDLLGYVDEKDYVSLLMDLAYKKETAVERIMKVEDIYGFFVYAWKVITDSQLFTLSPIQNRKDYQIRTTQDLIKSGNLNDLGKLFATINQQLYGVYNTAIVRNVFITFIYNYLSTSSVKTAQDIILKKVRKVKHE